MPLKVVSEALGLADPIVRANHPKWILAETLNLGEGMTALLVYRSSLLRKDDDWAVAGVEAMKNRAGCKMLIYRAAIPDEGMWWGEAEWRVWILYETPVPIESSDPRIRKLIAIVEDWGEPMHPLLAANELARRLALEVEEMA